MTGAARHDGWQTGDSYEAYMGRWSRAVAPRFLDWLDVPKDRDWVEVGCGTGALTEAIVTRCDPRSVVSLDLSESFVAKARANVGSPKADFRVGNAELLDLPAGSRDVVVSGLVLNFVPDKGKALAEARRVTRSGGMVAFYVWDYPGQGLEFVDAFWSAASSLDSTADDYVEARRFPICTPAGLSRLAGDAGLTRVEWTAIEVPTVFRDFEDFWEPFTLGAGPAPGYCASLAPEDRERLRGKLNDSLPRDGDGFIAMTARAWAVKSAGQ